MLQQTFAMIKPDGVRRGLTREICRRISDAGFRIIALKEVMVTREEAEANYVEHKGKPFYEDLIESIISGPVVKMVLERENAIQVWRELMGATGLADAKPGTIRGDLGHFGATPQETIVHGSDSQESAKREIALHFGG